MDSVIKDLYESFFQKRLSKNVGLKKLQNEQRKVSACYFKTAELFIEQQYVLYWKEHEVESIVAKRGNK